MSAVYLLRYFLAVCLSVLLIMFLLYKPTSLHTSRSQLLHNFSSPSLSAKLSTSVWSNTPGIPVAIILAGELRTFMHVAVRGTLMLNVILPLHRAGYPTHVFFHVDQPKQLNESILAPFQPTTVTSFSQRICAARPSTCFVQPHKLVTPFSLCRAQAAWNVVREFEQRKHVRFEWVYRLRPDIAFLKPVSLPKDLTRGVAHVSIPMPGTSRPSFPKLRELLGNKGRFLNSEPGDHMAILDRQTATIVMTAVRAFETCALWGVNATLNPETGLAMWLARHETSVQTHPWMWVLIRENGPECKRVRIMGRNAKEAKQRMSECTRAARDWGFGGDDRFKI